MKTVAEMIFECESVLEGHDKVATATDISPEILMDMAEGREDASYRDMVKILKLYTQLKEEGRFD